MNETPAVGAVGAEAAGAPGSVQVLEVPPAEAGERALAFFDPDALPVALLLLVGTALAVRLLHQLSRRLSGRFVVHRLAIQQGATLVGFIAYAIGAIVAVAHVFEFSTEAVFALSGTLALAAGFLLKDVAETVVAGLSILVTRPFSVGDRITFGGFYGEVRDIGLRTVRLVTLDDNLVSIPSSRFLSDPVASANAGALACMVVTPFYVAAHADHQRARELVRDAVLSSRFCYLGKPITLLVSMRLVEQLGVVVEITAKAYVFDARYEKSFASDVTERVLRALREHGIELPGAVAPGAPGATRRSASGVGSAA